MVVVTDEQGGVEGVAITIELGHAPVEGDGVAVVVPIAIEPEGADGAVLREEFGDLAFHEREVFVVVGR